MNYLYSLNSRLKFHKLMAMVLVAILALGLAPAAFGAPVITEYAVPTAASAPYGITAGPDGNLWFAESIGNKIGQLVPEEPPVPPTPGAPDTADIGAQKSSPLPWLATGLSVLALLIVGGYLIGKELKPRP